MPTGRRFAPLLAVLVVGAAVVVVVSVGAPDPVQAAPGDPAPQAGVQVEGLGTATGTPDVLHVTVGVETGGSTVEEALESANTAARRVLGALHDAGVDDADMQTVNVHVYPQYDRAGAEIAGYLAGQDLAVTLRALATAGETISAAVDAGGDAARLQAVSVALDDERTLRAQAREQAFADARQKAEQYAALAGRALDDVLLVRERVTPPPDPFPMSAGDTAAAAEAVPIAPGSSDVTVTVEVGWSLA